VDGVLELHRDGVADDPGAGGGGRVEGPAQLDAEAVADGVEEVRRRRAGGRREVAADAPRDVLDVSALVHHRAGRRELVEQHPLDGRGRSLPGRGRPRRARRRHLEAARGARREGERYLRPHDRVPAPEDPVPLVRRLEQIRVVHQPLGWPEQEVAAAPQRVVEERDHLPLEIGLQVDEQVPAGDQVERGEGRIADQAVHREDAHLAQLLSDVPARPVANEVALEALGRDVGLYLRGVVAGARLGDQLGVEVRREDLDEPPGGLPPEVLVHEDRDRVGLLARGAPGDPDPERGVGGLAGDEAGQDLPLERAERLRVAEELGDADEQVLQQPAGLVGILLQDPQVVGGGAGALELDAPADAAQQGAFLVAAEVVPGPLLQQGADRVPAVCELRVQPRVARAPGAREVPGMRDQRGGELLDLEDLVHQPRLDG
jgi:hypothetical protein